MFTSHGQQIPGSPVSDDKPTAVARCGGPGSSFLNCVECNRETAEYHKVQHHPDFKKPSIMLRINTEFLVTSEEHAGYIRDLYDNLQSLIQASSSRMSVDQYETTEIF